MLMNEEYRTLEIKFNEIESLETIKKIKRKQKQRKILKLKKQKRANTWNTWDDHKKQPDMRKIRENGVILEYIG